MHTVIGRADYLASLEPELSRYCALTGSVEVPFAGSTVQDLQAQLAGSGASSVFLLGSVPTYYSLAGDYGHGAEMEPADEFILPFVPTGRMPDWTQQPGVDPVATDKAYLTRFCDDLEAARNGDLSLPAVALRHFRMDHFSNQYGQFAIANNYQFSQFPASLTELHFADDPNQPGEAGPGPFLQGAPSMFADCFAGGVSQADAWFEGHYPQFLAANRKYRYISLWGSFLGKIDQPQSVMAAMLTWDTPLFVILNEGGAFPWRSFLNGTPIGQCVLQSNQWITSLIGSPLVTLRSEIVTAIPMLQSIFDRMDAQDAKIAALGTVPVNPAAPTPYHINGSGPALTSWQKSSFVTQGLNWPPASEPVTQPIDVTAPNSGPADLYKTYLTNYYPAPIVLTIPEPAGAVVTVRLHFAELHYTTAGQRPLNVSLNGTRVLSHWDPFTAAGAAYKAVVVDFQVTADAAGVTVRVEGDGNSYPLLCGVEVFTA